jgi:hypothetical protein
MKKIFAFLTLIIISLTLIACTQSNIEIKILNEDGEVIAKFNQRKGESITLIDMEKEGFVFTGWYSNDELVLNQTPIHQNTSFKPTFEAILDVFTYRVIQNSTIHVVKYDGNAKYLKFPYEIDGMKVSKILEEAFLNSSVIYLFLPNTISEIQSRAFKQSMIEEIDFYIEPTNERYQAIIKSHLPAMIEQLGNCEIASGTYGVIPWTYHEGCPIKAVVDEFIHLMMFDSYKLIVDTNSETYKVTLEIDPTAFLDATHLRKFTIPSWLKVISGHFFMSASLEEIVAKDHPLYQTIDGVLFSHDLKELLYYPSHFALSSYTLPLSVEKIQVYAFLNNQYLEELNLNEGLKYINSYAFQQTKKLETLMMPRTLLGIDNNFASDSSIREVILQRSIDDGDQMTYISFIQELTSITYYVPDQSLSVYLTTSYWFYLTDHIKPISEKP